MSAPVFYEPGGGVWDWEGRGQLYSSGRSSVFPERDQPKPAVRTNVSASRAIHDKALGIIECARTSEAKSDRRQRRIRIRRIERNMHLEYLIPPKLCGSRAYVRIHTLRPATRKRHFDRGRKRGFITLVVGWISVSAAVCGSPGRCAAARYELPRTAAWCGGQQLAFPDVNGRAAPCREATTFRSAVGP